jgi:predicted DNA-binding WGR domain protein
MAHGRIPNLIGGRNVLHATLLHCIGGTSDKFYLLAMLAPGPGDPPTTVRVHRQWGRGDFWPSKGQTKVETFAIESAAWLDMDALFREKIGKGYTEIAASTAASAIVPGWSSMSPGATIGTRFGAGARPTVPASASAEDVFGF